MKFLSFSLASSIRLKPQRCFYSNYLLQKYGFEQVPKQGPGGRSSNSGIKVTVFGNNGFLGPYLVNQLGQCGTQVVLPYRGDETDLNDLKPMGDLGQMVPMFFDIRNYESVLRCIEKSDVVVNLISQDYKTFNFTMEDANVVGARAIARAAAELKIPKLIFTSTLSANLTSPYEYSRTKARGEIATREEYPEASIVKLGTLFGHEDKLTRTFAMLMSESDGFFPILGEGKAIKRPIYVGDVARAIQRIIFDDRSPGANYELYNPNEYTVREVVDICRLTLEYGASIYNFSPRLLSWYMMYQFENDFGWMPFYRLTQLQRLLEDEIPTPLNSPNQCYRLKDLGIDHITSLEESIIEFLDRYRTAEKVHEVWIPIPPKPTRTD